MPGIVAWAKARVLDSASDLKESLTIATSVVRRYVQTIFSSADVRIERRSCLETYRAT